MTDQIVGRNRQRHGGGRRPFRTLIMLGTIMLVLIAESGCRVIADETPPIANVPCLVLHISTHATPCELTLAAD